MIKLSYCLRRKPGLSRDEFGRYWHDVHGPIGWRIPGLRRLVQVHTVEDGGYDGIAELWFDDLAALEPRAVRRSGRHRPPMRPTSWTARRRW